MSEIKFNRALAEQEQQNISYLGSKLKKTRAILTADIRDLVSSTRGIDERVLEEMECRLLVADVGIETTEKIIDQLTDSIEQGAVKDSDALIRQLRDIMLNILTQYPHRLDISKANSPNSILMVGVNGAGKTTTTGKLAKRFQRQGLSVMLAAGDTFRAGAVEQLKNWGEQNQVQVIAQAEKADAAAVSFDAMSSAKAKKINVLIADTAGRLHTQQGLMNELGKIKRTMAKVVAGAPTETLLVLDATLGQNALAQAHEFNKIVQLSGLILTKLDGTAKGGIVFALCEELKLPIRFIGIGEGIDDLKEFRPKDFVHALLADEE